MLAVTNKLYVNSRSVEKILKQCFTHFFLKSKTVEEEGKCYLWWGPEISKGHHDLNAPHMDPKQPLTPSKSNHLPLFGMPSCSGGLQPFLLTSFTPADASQPCCPYSSWAPCFLMSQPCVPQPWGWHHPAHQGSSQILPHSLLWFALFSLFFPPPFSKGHMLSIAWGTGLQFNPFPNAKWQGWWILTNSLEKDDTRHCQKLSWNKCTTTVHTVLTSGTSG